MSRREDLQRSSFGPLGRIYASAEHMDARDEMDRRPPEEVVQPVNPHATAPIDWGRLEAEWERRDTNETAKRIGTTVTRSSN